ncbi:MAG: hypothetical protein ACOYBE_09700 [Blautia sp.]|jgi:hypothetical protein
MMDIQTSDKLMYSPLESAFHSVMEREGRMVTAVTSGSQFKAFLRRNDDGNHLEDRITLFYGRYAPVGQGSIISLGSKRYLLINCESEENDCYYKSSGLACNGQITLNDGTLTEIPCYAFNMSGGLPNGGNSFSFIDGSMEFMTEDNQKSRRLQVNDRFNEFGRTWKISNVYHKDGILQLVTEICADEGPFDKKEADQEVVNHMEEAGGSQQAAGYEVVFTGANEIRNGFRTVLSAHLYQGKTEVDGSWTFETGFPYPDAVSVVQDGNKITVCISDDSHNLDEIITVTAVEHTHRLSVTRSLHVRPLF